MDVAELPRVTGRHRNKALAQQRRIRAVELAVAGISYQSIADQMGYANRGTVYRIVQEALKAHQVTSIDEVRATRSKPPRRPPGRPMGRSGGRELAGGTDGAQDHGATGQAARSPRSGRRIRDCSGPPRCHRRRDSHDVRLCRHVCRSGLSYASPTIWPVAGCLAALPGSRPVTR